MIIGFDYFHTINEFPELMSGLSLLFHNQGHKIIVVSGIANIHDEEEYGYKICKEMDAFGFHFDKLRIVMFASPIEVPVLKLAVAQKEGINVFFDDRKDVVDHFNAFGVQAIWVKRSLTRLPTKK